MDKGFFTCNNRKYSPGFDVLGLAVNGLGAIDTYIITEVDAEGTRTID